ncbi:methylmalonyl-CoA mutase metallochaperone MeaB [Flavobacteriaceae bacterium MAR_2009_75]|nr:methylmalonyl-CoA mutase metallochaperone MeaB [Flavobacteriaceae bacterium MAR_2009_75]
MNSDIDKSDNKEKVNIRETRKNEYEVKDLVKGVLSGDTTLLSKTITLIESTLKSDIEKGNAVLEQCLKKKTNSIRVGVTGVPGVGKSTFIETLGKQLIESGNKVAVLAVDPTSSQSKGSILGDKTRMESLVREKNAFIRPSPSSKSLGGVARKTRETIILCEAAGYNIILIETVGVGQSEIAVHGMADFFLLLKISGAGDELQGIKRGIIEMADAIVINKSDGKNIENTKLAAIEFRRAIELYPVKMGGWKPRVATCSSLDSKSVLSIWKIIEDYVKEMKQSSLLSEKRDLQNKNWLLETIEEQLKINFYDNKKVAAALNSYIAKVIDKEISPFKAAEELLRLPEKY